MKTPKERLDSHKSYWNDIWSNNVIFTDSNLNKSTTIPWDIKTYDKNIKPILVEFDINDGDVLELGCGLGHDANYFHKLGFNVTALDVSEVAIQKAKSTYNHINFVCSDFRTFNSNKKFDIIFVRGSTILQTCTQTNNGLETFMFHMSELLNNNGKVIILCGNYNDTILKVVRPVKFYISQIEQASLQFFKIKLVREIIMKQSNEYGDALGWQILMTKRSDI
jgi:2-polyprenyl-3-methyl-5-hydroxy-6-metoxy-1,4-benzoquinol methylase